MERMQREVAHPNFWITLDSGKAMLNNSGNSGVYDLIERLGHRIGSTHLYDYPAEMKYARILPGGRVVDVEGYVARLWKKGFRGPFSLETSGTRAEQKRAILTLTEFVQKAMAATP